MYSPEQEMPSMSNHESTAPSPLLVIVMGMHRSGTSLITNILAKAGFFLGEKEDLIGGNLWNRDGYFERASVVTTDDMILTLCGGDWQSPPLEETIAKFNADEKIKGLLRAFEGVPRSILKDPRMCLTFPIWKRNLTGDVRIINMTRSCDAVVKSLQRRDKFTAEKGKALWRTYTERAEKYIAGYPTFSLTYESLFSASRPKVLAELARFLDLSQDLEPIAVEVVDSSLNHSGLDSLDASLSGCWAQLYLPREDGYKEEANCGANVPVGDWAQITLPIRVSLNEAKDVLRLDPLGRDAIIDISSLTLRSAADDSIAWQAQTPDDFAGLRVSGTAIRVPHEKYLRIFSSSDDPQLYFPKFESAAFAGPMKLEVWMRVNIEPEAIADMLSELIAGKSEKAAAFEKQLDVLRSRLDDAQSQLGQVEQAKAEQQAAVARMETELAEQRQALRRESSEHREALRQAESKVGEMDSLLDQRERELAWLQSVLVHWGKWAARQKESKAVQLSRVGEILTLQNQRMRRFLESTSTLLRSIVGEATAQEVLPVETILGTMPPPETIRELTDHKLAEMQAAYQACAPYFDSAFYLEKYPDIAAAGLDPLQHFIEHGLAEGRLPNPLFDPAYYLGRYPDVAASGMNPLQHYAEIGAQEGRIAHPALEGLVGSEDADRSGLAEESLRALDAGGIRSDLHKYLKERIEEVYEKSPEYMARSTASFAADGKGAKVIAFYFPQFHPFPENEKFWGKGFTEWTSVTKANPLYKGHWQPRLPSDLGFYDLRIKDVMKEQIDIAKQYGIYGFCFHHYWFSGQRVMRVPYNHMLANPDLDIPFCLHWANEPWTVRWDGFANSGVLLDQKHTPEDDMAFIQDITPALRDPRYIRIQGRPLLIIYRPGLFPDIQATIGRWRAYCEKNKLGDLYLTMMQTGFDGQVDPHKYGFDAAIEYPPHNMRIPSLKDTVQMLVPDFAGDIFGYPDLVETNLRREKPDYTLFRGLFPNWDCTPRRKNAVIFKDSTPSLYQKWLEGQIRYSNKNLPPAERFLFINAWNEWAEGAYLEPDRRYGYAYLEATRRAIQNGAGK
jgi:hypothetical protein